MDFVAKANPSGLTSVSESLEVEGHGNVAYQREKNPNNAYTKSSSSNNDYVCKQNVEAVGESVKPKPKRIFSLRLNCLKVLGLKEGQAISIVHELFSSSHRKRKQYSSVIWMMIHLLNLISEDRNLSLSLSANNDSWFVAIGNVLLKSGVLNDDFPPETFEGGVAKYMEINASKRLKLLIFLCDEALNTNTMRDCIENKQEEFKKKKKETDKKAATAKNREKELKKMMRSDLVKDHMENTRTLLSIEEHRAILSQLRTQVKEAHDENLEAKEMASKNLQILNVMGNAPIILDGKGLVLWKLNCYQEEPKFLLQDVGTFDQACPHEKWLTFKAEQKQDIETFISTKKMKLKRAQKKMRKQKRRTQKNVNAIASELAPNHNVGVVISEPS